MWDKIVSSVSKTFSSLRSSTGEYTGKSTEFLRQKSGEYVISSKNYITNQNRALWKYINLKNRSISLLLGTGRWLASTRAARVTKWGAVFGALGHLSYVYGTQFQKEITVSKTFNQLKETRRGIKNQYFIADSENKLYQVVPSLWYWQWWEDELWASIEKGETYWVQGYGVKIQKLRIHPRIVFVRKAICSKPQ